MSWYTSLNQYAKEHPEFAACRDLAHPWDLVGVDIESGHYLRNLRCPRCGTLRQQRIDSFGLLLRNTYSYPDGYPIPEVGRLARADRATLRRAMVRAEYESATANPNRRTA